MFFVVWGFVFLACEWSGVWRGRVGVGVGWFGWCGGVGECARVFFVVWASCSWRVRGLGCALVCGFWEWCVSRVCGCLGAGKAGREPVVWFSPRFFFFLCGADDGT